MTLPRLTADGRSGLLLFLVVIVAAFNTGSNLVFLLAATLVAAYVLSLATSRTAVGGLRVRLQLPSSATEGAEVPLGLVVRNDGRRPARLVQGTVVLRSTQGTSVEALPAERGGLEVLLPGEERTLALSARLPQRGDYRVLSAAVSSPWPLGLLSWPRPVECPHAALAVLPSLLTVGFRGISHHQQESKAEDTRTYARGGGQDFHALRRYQPGDPLKLVHWRSTARTGELMVQEFQKNLTARYYVYLDVDEARLDRPGPEANLEHSVRLCATLCCQLARENALSQVLIYQDDVRLSPPVFTAADAHRMLRFLSSVTYTRGCSLPRLLERTLPAVVPDSFLVFILAGLDDETTRAIRRVAGAGQGAVAVLNARDAAEAARWRESANLAELRRASVRVVVAERRSAGPELDLDGERAPSTGAAHALA